MRASYLTALIPLLLSICSGCKKEQTLLVRLDPGKTGIHFSNHISENDTINILSLEYVYNGGGVAAGDFNNDGLQDLYFTGNTADNKLYLNKGGLEFSDITEEAGVNGAERWCSGVAAIDINCDGWLDLYVCATVLQPASKRTNLLYINQGIGSNADSIPTFKEMAQDYGIADNSHTTNAAFFDYDNDGDNDLYLLINEMEKQHQPNRYRAKITDGSSPRTDKLFRNDWDEIKGHPNFTDVSKAAGITIEGYGLGLNVCDVNRDGWKDIYVCNDYLSNDLLWINNGDGTFSDKAAAYLKHTSYSAMGNDVADVNNDGLPDLVALDMLPEDNFRRKTMLPPVNYITDINNDRFGYQYQYVRNTLQINEGVRPGTKDLLFSEVAMLAGIHATDWSWSPLFADIDHDGFRDLLVTNGFPKDVTDRDFMDYHSEVGNIAFQANLLPQIPSVKINNYAFKNTGSRLPVFDNVSAQWGMHDASFSSGAAYVDLDNDGDLDYVTNNINDSAFVYQNLLMDVKSDSTNWLNINFAGGTKNPQGLGAIAEIYYANNMQYWDNTPYRGYLSTVETGAHFGLGKTTQIDSVRITWQEGLVEVLYGVKANKMLKVDIKNARPGKLQGMPANDHALFTDVTQSIGIDYIHRDSNFIDFNYQRLLLHKLSQYGPGIAVGDVNGDQLEDFYISGSTFYPGTFFVQSEQVPNFAQVDLFVSHESEKIEEELGALLFDADNDGDNDLYLVSGSYEMPAGSAGYQDKLFINRNGKFSRDHNALPQFFKSGSCVRAADFDHDGDLDLFVGGRVIPGEYPRPLSSYLLRNDLTNDVAKFSIVNETNAPGLDSIGMICDALWTDFDNDSWPDLLLAGEYLGLQLFRNKGGVLSPHVDNVLAEATGLWNSLAAADFDLDGDIDYVAGNLGLNNIMKTKPLHESSAKTPAGSGPDGEAKSDETYISIYAADFDGNKALDAIPVAFFPDMKGQLAEFPYFQRVDMEKQIVKLKGLFPRHENFGVATIHDVVSKFSGISPLVLHARWLPSSYVENLGNGTFAIRPLPMEAQVSPVYGMLAEDFTGDGLPDFLLAGNDFGTEVGMGRYDAMNGLLLAGDGKGNFNPMKMQESGICISGDAKSLVSISMSNGSMAVVAGQNKDRLLVFQHRGQPTLSQKSIAPTDIAAIITLSDGRVYRKEFFFGQGFLSQPSRILYVLPDVKSIEVVNFRGEKRIL